MNGWKTLTDMEVNAESIARIEQYCSELLIHAADVEGLCQGIDEELVTGASSSPNHQVADSSPCEVGLDPVHVCRRREGARRPRARRPAVGGQGRLDVWLGAGHFWRAGRQVRRPRCGGQEGEGCQQVVRQYCDGMYCIASHLDRTARERESHWSPRLGRQDGPRSPLMDFRTTG